METKKVVDQAVVKMKISSARTRTCRRLPSDEAVPGVKGEEGRLVGVDRSRSLAMASMLTAKK